MKFSEQKMHGVFLIEATPFVDDRGAFRRGFCDDEFSKQGIASVVRQSNISENIHAYTLRGFHYQEGPFGEGKTLTCLRGKIHDLVVDLRPESKTYLSWISFELSGDSKKSIHIPPGCANAFLTLEDDCLIQYYCSQPYTPSAEKGIRFDDPIFSFEWPHSPRFISEKDRSHPDFAA